MIEAVHHLIEHDTADDPVTGIKWARRTTDKVADELWRSFLDIVERVHPACRPDGECA